LYQSFAFQACKSTWMSFWSYVFGYIEDIDATNLR
jgi:hypothetical protein